MHCVISNKLSIIMIYRKLSIDVNTSDSSYMPRKITVQGGASLNAMVDINNVSTVMSLITSFIKLFLLKPELIRSASLHCMLEALKFFQI